ncbi:MAG TPA: hypothetical protein VFI06_17600 [Chitinophagaceae bacterium]|nr:hypothetical protein [Chitinophagaceae bacterium]
MVSADIINSDGPASKDKFQQYYMVITLTNTQDTNIRFTVMTCSWSESFRFDTDSIYLYYPGCDSNFPTTIEILPHKTVKFFGILTCYKKNRNAINPPSFKIAFLDLPYNDWFLFPYSHEDKLKYKTYWSDSIKLERKLYSYEEEK